MRSRAIYRAVTTRAIITATLVATTFAPAFAQSRTVTLKPPARPAVVSQAIAKTRFDPAIKNRRSINDPQGMFRGQMHQASRGMWTAVGAVVGAVGVGYLGSAFGRDCRCDSPGMQGFMIGMPIGGCLAA
jgi:hypothetical protein